MEQVKFCNISKATRLGIRPGCSITVSKAKANQLAVRLHRQMGKNFIIIPDSQTLDMPVYSNKKSVDLSKQSMDNMSNGKKKWPTKQ